MTTNHRTTCVYCKTSVLTRDYGKHLLTKHEDHLFDKLTSDGQANLRSLWREKYEKEPLCLSIKDDLVYFCLSDFSSLKRLNLAEQKVKKNKDDHRSGLLKLRDKFPDPKGVVKDGDSQGLTPTLIDAIQNIVWELVDHIRDSEKHEGEGRWAWEHTCKRAISLLPFSLKEAELKAKFEEPEEDEEPETKEEKKEEEEEEWKLPEPPKPKINPVLVMVKDVIHDKTIPLQERQQYLRQSMVQHKLSDPEFESFLALKPEPPKPVSKPVFNPQSYITVPEPPKLPTILQSTKRAS